MSYCVCCGSPVPKGQNTCSMCYGDMDHGTDGYYRQWAEEEMRRQAEEREAEERQEQEWTSSTGLYSRKRGLK